MSKTTLDLSTLSDIADGAHTVKVKAKASGYNDSEFSNEVSYTKVPPATFKRVYLTKVGPQYSSNTLSKLENMDTSKVYSITTNIPYVYCFTYENGTWVSDDPLMYITSQTTNSVTFHHDNSYYQVYINYIALEGTQKATGDDMAKYPFGTDAAYADWQCFVENTLISTNGGDKPVQDITYDDDILVWNFDEGKLDYAKPVFIKQEQTSDSYWHVTDENGKTVNLVGSDGKSHRLYNKRTHLFE